MDTNATPVPAPEPTPAPKKEMREKYIRTFAGDMDIFQKGGTPGLAPLKPAPAPIAPPLPPEAPMIPPIPFPEEISAPHAPLKVATPAERLVEASPVVIKPVSAPRAPIAPADVLPAPLPPKKFEDTSPLKTYSEDFRAHVKETKASTATILAAEQDAKTGAPAAEISVPDNKNLWYSIAGVMLFVITGIGAYFAYTQYGVTNAPVVIAPVASTPIFVDSREKVSGTGIALMQAIKQSVDKPLAVNTVRLLSFDSTPPTSVFLSLGMALPDILSRNVTADMAGVVSVMNGGGAAQSPFFILAVSSYSASFSGMLSWESKMQNALETLYPLYTAATTVTSTVSTFSTTTPTTTTTTKKVTTKTTTTILPAPAPQEGFRDEVVGNHDVRIYRDAAGRSILLYGYWDQSTLIIARDPSAFAEILGRLATAHTR